MAFFTSPTSFRNNVFLSTSQPSPFLMANNNLNGPIPFDYSTIGGGDAPPHASHPALGHLILLVFEAVLEVVCVALPGYIIARSGMFDAEMQKFVANLNVTLFTPCLSEFLICCTRTVLFEQRCLTRGISVVQFLRSSRASSLCRKSPS